MKEIENKIYLLRYSADNDRRSSHYDDLLASEDKAIKSAKGLHDKKNIPTRLDKTSLFLQKHIFYADQKLFYTFVFKNIQHYSLVTMY